VVAPIAASRGTNLFERIGVLSFVGNRRCAA